MIRELDIGGVNVEAFKRDLIAISGVQLSDDPSSHMSGRQRVLVQFEEGRFEVSLDVPAGRQLRPVLYGKVVETGAEGRLVVGVRTPGLLMGVYAVWFAMLAFIGLIAIAVAVARVSYVAIIIVAGVVVIGGFGGAMALTVRRLIERDSEWLVEVVREVARAEKKL